MQNYYVTLIDKETGSKIIIGEITASSRAWCKAKARVAFYGMFPNGDFYGYLFRAHEVKYV